MTQAAELAGYASNLQMFRNKIINGNFDVWQRGTNISISNSTNMYTADRWRFAGDAFTGFINRQQFTPGQTDVPGEPNYFFRWAVNTNPSGNMAFGQYIEDVRTLAGRTATLSLYLYASATIPANTLQIRYRQVTGGTGGTNNTINIGEITTSWKKFTFQLNIPSGDGRYRPAYCPFRLLVRYKPLAHQPQYQPPTKRMVPDRGYGCAVRLVCSGPAPSVVDTVPVRATP